VILQGLILYARFRWSGRSVWETMPDHTVACNVSMLSQRNGRASTSRLATPELPAEVSKAPKSLPC